MIEIKGKKMVKKEIIKTVVLDCLSRTTVHALPNIVKTNSNILLRILWTVSFLSCSVICFYSCITLTQIYYSYEISTKISIIQEIPTEFPTVSFCNSKLLNQSNPITLRYFNINLLVKNASYYDSFVLPNTFPNDRNLTISDRKIMSFQIEHIFRGCWYNSVSCDVKNFTYFYSPLYGNCYSFNSGLNNDGTKYPIRKVPLNSDYYGLFFEMFPDSGYDVESKFIISIHNQSIAPFTKGNSYTAPVNMETKL